MQAQTSQSTYVGVALSGGLSSRMGQDKGDLVLGEHSLLAQTCTLLVNSGLQLILISSNNPAQGIVDRYPKCGPLGGMHSIFCHLKEGLFNVAGVVFVPVDMPELSCNEITEIVKQGKVSGRPVCFKENYLPLYLPFNEDIFAYLEQAVSGLISRSVHALIENFHGEHLDNKHNDSFININTPSQWQDYSQHKITQEKS